MANPDHVQLVTRGADAISVWRKGHPFEQLDLCFADLYLSDLAQTNLEGANLRFARLGQAQLWGAKLNFANLLGAQLNGAALSGSDFSQADLGAADLTCTNLMGTKFIGANLNEADLHGAMLKSTSFDDVDLSRVTGLDRVQHHGPSNVSISTLYHSRGKIPAAFLRGCGVPDSLIESLPTLVNMQKEAECYSCFISHSHKDGEFAKLLTTRMRDNHLRVWHAPEDMEGGKKLEEQIDDAIRAHDKLLVVLSNHSMSSEWVKTEVRKARKREETEGKRVQFPIRLVSFDAIREWEAFDADTGKDMAVELREYFIPDFSNWKHHDAFEAAFSRLLDDLNRDDESQ